MKLSVCRKRRSKLSSSILFTSRYACPKTILGARKKRWKVAVPGGGAVERGRAEGWDGGVGEKEITSCSSTVHYSLFVCVCCAASERAHQRHRRTPPAVHESHVLRMDDRNNLHPCQPFGPAGRYPQLSARLLYFVPTSLFFLFFPTHGWLEPDSFSPLLCTLENITTQTQGGGDTRRASCFSFHVVLPCSVITHHQTIQLYPPRLLPFLAPPPQRLCSS